MVYGAFNRWGLATNNGGWQWCASTGTDAVPYFKFLTLLLNQRNLIQMEIIFVNGLKNKHLDNKAIHEPTRLKQIFS